nr:hypothetical protein [Rhodomicrobium vannielii]
MTANVLFQKGRQPHVVGIKERHELARARVEAGEHGCHLAAILLSLDETEAPVIDLIKRRFYM